MVSWSLNWLLIMLINGGYECLNTWNKTIGLNGEDIWISTSSFIPSQSQSYGTIRLGQIINVEFDFIFKGRTNNPRQSYAENFFRIGHNAENGKSCDGDGSRYPSLWLSPGNTNTGYLDISTTSGTLCAATAKYIVHEYGTINIDILHHIKIEIIPTQITIHISGGNKPNYTQIFNRKPTMKHHINQSVGVWFMSNRFTGTPYNIGNGIFSNIIITSNIFTHTPHPTFEKIVPIFYPTYSNPTTENPTFSPTKNIISNIPTYHPIHISHPTTEKPTHNPTVHPLSVHTIMSKPTRTPTPRPSINNSNTNKPSIYPSWNSTMFLTSFLPSNSNTNTYSYDNNSANNGLNIWTTVMATVAIFAFLWTIMIICCIRLIKKYQIKHDNRYNTALAN